MCILLSHFQLPTMSLSSLSSMGGFIAAGAEPFPSAFSPLAAAFSPFSAASAATDNVMTTIPNIRAMRFFTLPSFPCLLISFAPAPASPQGSAVRDISPVSELHCGGGTQSTTEASNQANSSVIPLPTCGFGVILDQRLFELN